MSRVKDGLLPCPPLRYAAWNSTLDEYERRFRAMATCVDAFDHPIETGLLMARDDFCRWSASESRDLMLWFVNGEVWIAGVRNSPCHVLAYGAFQQLMLSVNRCKFVGHEYALLAVRWF